MTNQPQGPEYTPCTQCSHIEPEHRPDAGPCLLCDCAAYRPAPAVPAGQAPATDQAAVPAVWIDGHPQLEAIAAAVWEKCGTDECAVVTIDDPRNIAVAALGAVSRELAAFAEYENTINWMTTCTSCARVMDSSIRETERAARTEAAIARVRALHRRNDNTGDCEHCSERDYPDYAVSYPCLTITALDEPKETTDA